MNLMQVDNFRSSRPNAKSSERHIVYHPDAVAGRLIAIGAVLLLMFAAVAWASGLASFLRHSECRSWPTLLVFGQETDASLLVRGTVPCSLALQAPSLAVDELKMATLPENGTVMSRGRTGVTYLPGRNFKGDDFFAFTVHGRSALQEGTSLVRVHVSVR
jgi:hypothetical protein